MLRFLRGQTYKSRATKLESVMKRMEQKPSRGAWHCHVTVTLTIWI